MKLGSNASKKFRHKCISHRITVDLLNPGKNVLSERIPKAQCNLCNESIADTVHFSAGKIQLNKQQRDVQFKYITLFDKAGTMLSKIIPKSVYCFITGM